jgi:zinc protease
VNVSYDPLSIGPALLRIDAIPAAGITLEELETALDRALVNLMAQPLDAPAIARAKTLLVAEITFAQDGLESLATVVAELYAIGKNEQFFYDWSQTVEAVTPEVARDAARSVLVSKSHVTGYLKPQMPQAEAADAL